MKHFFVFSLISNYFLNEIAYAQINKNDLLAEVAVTGYYKKYPWKSYRFEDAFQTTQDYDFNDKLSTTFDLKFSMAVHKRFALGLNYLLDYVRTNDVNFRTVFDNGSRPVQGSGNNGMYAIDERTQLHSLDPFFRVYLLNMKRFALFIEPGGGSTYSRTIDINNVELKQQNSIVYSAHARDKFEYVFGNLKADAGFCFFVSDKVGIEVNAGIIKYYIPTENNNSLDNFTNTKKRFSLGLAYKI